MEQIVHKMWIYWRTIFLIYQCIYLVEQSNVLILNGAAQWRNSWNGAFTSSKLCLQIHSSQFTGSAVCASLSLNIERMCGRRKTFSSSYHCHSSLGHATPVTLSMIWHSESSKRLSSSLLTVYTLSLRTSSEFSLIRKIYTRQFPVRSAKFVENQTRKKKCTDGFSVPLLKRQQ